MRRRSLRERVVITGMGAVTPLGLCVEEFWRGLVEGRSGIDYLTLCDAEDLPCKIAGEVKDFKPTDFLSAKEARHTARFMQFAVAAAREAIESARLDLSKENRERVGVLLGNGSGGLPETERECVVLYERGPRRVSPFFIPSMLANMAAAQVSITFGLRGYNSTIITSCAAGAHAIGEAAEIIRRGWADVMLAGGTEAGLTRLGIAGFCSMKALTTRNEEPTKASRPFDAKRDGFVPAEGAGILVLESLEHALRRDAPILAELVGFGITASAYHLVAPEPDAAEEARAMKLALEDAGLRPEDIDYINAHGTSTPLNDKVETLAIKKVFGELAYKIPVSSNKSMIGHLLGAAGAVEAIASVKTILEGIIPPTINYEHRDPECDLDYVPNRARKKEVKAVLSNSFGFGGQNCCLIFRAFEE